MIFSQKAEQKQDNGAYVYDGFVSRTFSGFLQTNGTNGWDSPEYKSLFLDRYGAHFTVAHLNSISLSLGRLMNNTAPDALTLNDSGSREHATPGFSVGTGVFTAGYKTLNPGARTLGRPVTRDGVWRAVRGLRYGWRIHPANALTKQFRGRVTGYHVMGRRIPSLSMRLRYGCAVRSLYWWFHVQSPTAKTNPDRLIIASYFHKPTEHGNFGGFFAHPGEDKPKPFDFREQRFILFAAMAGIHHLRTVWYSTNRLLASHFSQENLIGRFANKCWARTEGRGYSLMDSAHITQYRVLSQDFGARSGVSGTPLRRGADSDTYSHFIRREHARHANYRIVIGRYEAKLWNYKKTRQYWRFMRWVSHFFFKGLCYLRFFTLRIDIFLVNHLRIRNIALSRLLVKGGHAFVGEESCKNPAQYVGKYDVVSLSREVLRWMTYGAGHTGRGIQNNTWNGRVRTVAFARPASTGGIFHGRFGAFAVLHGDYVDLVSTETRRFDNSWSAFNYFQGQRVITSAWW